MYNEVDLMYGLVYIAINKLYLLKAVWSMTYQEKKSIVSLVSSILIFAAYCLYRYQQYPEGAPGSKEMLHYWGSFVLILTLVSIAAHIVISIIFNIVFRMTTGEKEPAFADELDKRIDMLAFRNSFASGFLSDVTGSLSRLYHYRRGV